MPVCDELALGITGKIIALETGGVSPSFLKRKEKNVNYSIPKADLSILQTIFEHLH